MIVDFKLMNANGLIIGKARLDLPTEDIEAAKLGLKATGMAYSRCCWVIYDIYWQNNGPQECHGRMFIRSCQEDS